MRCTEMTSWTPDVSEWTMISVGFIQGVSIGFLTIPINIITFATLPSELRTEATGIYSLMRNLGSAIGISITGALLEINTQVNHAIIAGEVTPFNRALQSRCRVTLLEPRACARRRDARPGDNPAGANHRLYR